MIKITVIALGALKESYLKESSREYEKRLSRYCSLNIIELEPIKLSSSPSESEVLAVLEKEADLITPKIPKGSKVISLCVEGKELSSEAFAEVIEQGLNIGQSLTFIIGSSYGLSKRIKAQSDLRLSVSKMTFPHRLFRIMLLEQIYRGFKINEGSTYHK